MNNIVKPKLDVIIAEFTYNLVHQFLHETLSAFSNIEISSQNGNQILK